MNDTTTDTRDALDDARIRYEAAARSLARVRRRWDRRIITQAAIGLAVDVAGLLAGEPLLAWGVAYGLVTLVMICAMGAARTVAVRWAAVELDRRHTALARAEFRAGWPQ